jgi:hypothetical protein
MRTRIVLLSLLAATSAAGQEHAATPIANRVDLDSITALVVTFASCTALHVAAAETLERAGLTAYAATARRRAEIDQLAVTYLLTEDRIAKGGAALEPASFTGYVQQLTAQARDRMLAIVENPDPAPYKREEAVCSSLIPLEDEILAKISAD